MSSSSPRSGAPSGEASSCPGGAPATGNASSQSGRSPSDAEAAPGRPGSPRPEDRQPEPERTSRDEPERVLFVVATPIGNLGDLSARARDVLASVELIAAEDTRHTRQLLQACGIDTPLTSLHEHNEGRKSAALVERLAQGGSLALVSDAGTPLISDPGFALIAEAKKRGIPVMVVPGPCAAIAALCVAGLPTDRFVFEGFLPAKGAARRARLERLATQERTLIFYEAPHRLQEVLDDLRDMLGAQRQASISRELTKRFETTYSGTLQALSERVRSDADMSRGEIVLVVAGNSDPAPAARDSKRLLEALLEELSPSQAARVAARLTGEKRSDLYDRAMGKGSGN